MNFEDWESIHEYCMSKACAYETRPFGKYPVCYRVAGKIFAQLHAEGDIFRITLKTNPEAADFYRRAYPGVVVRGYHCPPVQQPYWNTIDLHLFDGEVLFQMIDEAYDEVRTRLPGKVQRRLPVLSECRFIKTDGQDPVFAGLCEKLDENLDEIVGKKIQRQKYVKYNQRDNIHDVIIVYREEKPVACGSYKFYDEETVEVKRIFVEPSVRGLGVGMELMRRLEVDARINGYRFAILETGELLTAACSLYKKLGYRVIPNYGPYADMPESLCMEKKL